MDEAEAPKRRGRPRKWSVGSPRPTLSFRVSDTLHKNLIASAIQSQRSLSEEIERILEAHFLAGDLRDIIRQELAGARRPIPVARPAQPEPYINQSAPPH